jgi:hypothetical protein
MQPSICVVAARSDEVLDCGRSQNNSALQEPVVLLPERAEASEVEKKRPAEPQAPVTSAAKEACVAEKVNTGRIPRDETPSAAAEVKSTAGEVAGLAGETGAESAVVAAVTSGLACTGEDVAEEEHVVNAEAESSTEGVAQTEPEADLESEQVPNCGFQNLKEATVTEVPGRAAERQAEVISCAQAAPVAEAGGGPLVAAEEASLALPSLDEAVVTAAVADMDLTAGSLRDKKEEMMNGSGSKADQDTGGSADTAGELRPKQRVCTQRRSSPPALCGSGTPKTAAAAAAAAAALIAPLGRRTIIPPKRLIASISTDRPDSSPIRLTAASDQVPATRRADFVIPNASAGQKRRHRAEILQPPPSPGVWRNDPAVQGAQRRAEEVLYRRIAGGELRAAVDPPGRHQFAIAGYPPPAPLPCSGSLVLLPFLPFAAH